MTTRLFYQPSTATWLRRIDENSPLPPAQAQAHAEAEFNLPGDVAVVDIDAFTEQDRLDLTQAPYWAGMPPAIPVPSLSPADGPISPPPYVPTPQEAQDQSFNDIHVAALNALANWGSLSLAQKDTILKNLLRWALWKDRRLPYES